MWIKGCGVRGSIGCYGRGPDFPGYVDGRQTAMRSLDWRAMLEQGHEYELRVTVGVRTWSDGALNSSFLDTTTYPFSGLLDVYYRFRYPGWVLQDENGGGQDVQDLGWALGRVQILSDQTYASWPSHEDPVFYPPYSNEYRHMVITSCNGFQHAMYDATCSRYTVGSAGIINTRTPASRIDPEGSCECSLARFSPLFFSPSRLLGRLRLVLLSLKQQTPPLAGCLWFCSGASPLAILRTHVLDLRAASRRGPGYHSRELV